MASGVSVDPEVLLTYTEVKQKKNITYVLYKMSDDKKNIIFETKHPKTAGVDYAQEEVIKNAWMDFIQVLPDKGCRYAVFDFSFLLPDGSKREKIVFISWCPDIANIKEKMLYASSKDALKKSLLGYHAEIQANDKGDLEYNSIKERLSRKAA